MSKKTSQNSRKYIQPTLASVPVGIDPAAKGTPIRYAMAIEAVFNILGGTWMVFFPEGLLNLMVAKPSDITPASLALTQQFGALVYALTTPLVLAIPNTRRGIESRQSVYYTLASGEILMISLSLYQAYILNGGGFSPTSLLAMSANLAPMLLWRLYVLFMKPEWLGRYREDRKDY